MPPVNLLPMFPVHTPMKVAASVAMDGGVWDGVLMAPPLYQIAPSYGVDGRKARFPFVFMSPDPVFQGKGDGSPGIGNGCRLEQFQENWINSFSKK